MECGTPAPWGWAFCRSIACHRCRRYRAAAWVAEDVCHFSESRRSDLRTLTLTILPSVRTSDLPRTIRREKVAIRNLIYRMRQHDPRANGLRVAGCIQADWLPDAGEWLLRFRLVIDLAGLPERVFMDWLNNRWANVGQIKVRSIEPGDDLKSLLAEIQALNDNRHSDFWLAVHHGGGFPLVRFRLKPVRRVDRSQARCEARWQPMPMTFA